MSETKHTPGPWSFRQAESPGHEQEFDHLIHTEDRRHVAVCFQFQDPEHVIQLEEALANARLIAAAPELLQAAQNLMADIDKDDIAGVGYTPARHLALADAIFKATA